MDFECFRSKTYRLINSVEDNLRKWIVFKYNIRQYNAAYCSVKFYYRFLIKCILKMKEWKITQLELILTHFPRQNAPSQLELILLINDLKWWVSSNPMRNHHCQNCFKRCMSLLTIQSNLCAWHECPQRSGMHGNRSRSPILSRKS